MKTELVQEGGCEFKAKNQHTTGYGGEVIEGKNRLPRLPLNPKHAL